ncbi:MAG: hypothetical protein U1D55_03100 [Phycisphaerae bacterium]
MLSARGVAQSQPASSPAMLGDESLAVELRAALSDLRDFTMDFSNPAFYGLVRHVAGTNTADSPPVALQHWTELAERPRDFRGRRVTISGRVGRNSGYEVRAPEARGLGTLWQLELSRGDEQIACTLILTQDASDIPIGAWVEATGYFLMVRQYAGASNRIRQAALIIARGPTSISTHEEQPVEWRQLATWGGGTLLVGLLLAWILLRRAASAPVRHDPSGLHATSAPAVNLAKDLQAWAEQTPPSAQDEPPQTEEPSR